MTNNNLYNLLDKASKLGLEQFKHELETCELFDGLLWTEVKQDDGNTEIVLELFDKITYNTEYFTSYEFNSSGMVI